jgi:hypothetical protein
MDRWVEVAKRRRREIAAAVAAFIKEACRVGDVALFGSRARGDFHDMSDWDLAVVTQDGEYAVKTEEFGQVVYIVSIKVHKASLRCQVAPLARLDLSRSNNTARVFSAN